MSAPPYMRLYWGDYLRDTRHLKGAREHGAYLLILGEMWSRGGKLPDDDALLAKIALCTPKEWAAIRPRIIGFFRIAKGHLTQKRLAAELAKYRATISARKKAGKKGSEAKRGKDRGNSAANAKQMPPKPEPEPESSLEGSKKPSKTTRRERADERADGSSTAPADVIDLDKLRDQIAEAERQRLQRVGQ